MKIIGSEMPAVAADKHIVEQVNGPASIGERLWLPLLFAVVLSAHLMHHFLYQHAKATFAYDCHYYLFTCSQIINYILAVVHGHLTWSALSQPGFVTDILRDGPIATGLPAIVLSWLGREVNANDWRIFVVLLSILQSISACFVAMICRRITGIVWPGLVAGLLFGLYPTSLVVSGLYLSENIVILLELAFVFCLSLATSKLSARIMSGVLAGMLCMAKPALIPGIGIAIIVGTLFSSIDTKKLSLRRFSLLLSIAAVTALTILPWAVYTKLAYGKMVITIQRFPNYNAAVGTDIETDGWCVSPLTDRQTHLIYSSISPAAIMIDQWCNKPLPMLMLTIKRITRMFAYPWNIFRETVFGIDGPTQQYIHIGSLLLCVFGVYAYLFDRARSLNKQGYLLANLSLIMIAGHFVYLFFQAMARYSYSAMPFLFVFAGYGIFYANQRCLDRKVLITGTIALLSVLLICKAEAITKLGEPTETSHVIDSGVIAKKHIDLSKAKISSELQQALIIVDADKEIAGARIIINGHRVSEPARLINHFGRDQYNLFIGYRELSNLMNFSVSDFRQWRAVPIPISWVHLDGDNIIDIAGGTTPFKIFGDSQNTREMLSPNYTAGDAFTMSMDSMETRIKAPVLTEPVIQGDFIGKKGSELPVMPEGLVGAGLAPPACIRPLHQRAPMLRPYKSNDSATAQTIGMLPDSLRIKLALISPDNYLETNAKSTRGLDHCVLGLDPTKVDPMARDHSDSSICVSRYILGHLGGVYGSINVPALNRSSHAQFKVTGEYRVLHGPGKLAISVDALGPGSKKETLGMTPNYIQGDHTWRSFEIDDLLPMGTLGNKLEKIVIGLWPLPWLDAQYGADKECSEAQFRNIKVEIWTRQLPDISQGHVSYY